MYDFSKQTKKKPTATKINFSLKIYCCDCSLHIFERRCKWEFHMITNLHQQKCGRQFFTFSVSLYLYNAFSPCVLCSALPSNVHTQAPWHLLMTENIGVAPRSWTKAHHSGPVAVGAAYGAFQHLPAPLDCKQNF